MYIDSSSRYCYLRGGALAAMWTNPKVLDALLDQLQVPGKMATLTKLSMEEKQRAIEAQIDHFRSAPTSRWRDTPSQEVLAASVYAAESVPRRLLADHFGALPRESDLLSPVAAWLQATGYKALPEIPLGKNRVDLLGFKDTFFSMTGKSIVAVELKNDLSQLKRGLDQMTTFAEYAHYVYLACTPALAMEYLWNHNDAVKGVRWETDVLQRKLGRFNFGLLLVEGNEVSEVISSGNHSPASDRISQVAKIVEAMATRSAQG